MNPKVKEKLSGMAWEKGIDISVLLWENKSPIPSVDALVLDKTLSKHAWLMEAPEVSAESVYENIKEQFVPLDSEELLKVLHLILMNRSENIQD